MTEVFLSYSRCDRRFAERTATVLREHGIACFLDVALLSPGSDWARAVDDALDRCSAVVLIASRESLASPSCAREWRRAIRAGKPVIVAGIEQIAIPDELREQPSVDLRRRAATAWRTLVGAVRGSPEHAPSLSHVRVPPPLLLAGLSLAVLLAFQSIALFDLIDRACHARVPSARAAVMLVVQCLIVAAWHAHTARWSWRFLRREQPALGLVRMTFVPAMWTLGAIFLRAGWMFPDAMLVLVGMVGIAALTLKSLAW